MSPASLPEFTSDRVVSFADVMVGMPPGLVLEFGVERGHSLIEIATATNRPVFGFDWFFGLPEKWGAYEAGSYTCDGQLPNMLPANVHLVIGRVEDTLGPFLHLFRQPLAFAHMDLDLYRPTLLCLVMLHARFQPGTILVFDELVGPDRNVEHESRALAEFLKTYSDVALECIGQRHEEAVVLRVV